MKATKFRDSNEFSECGQNVLAKGCLPCRCLYVNQNNQSAKRPKYELSPTGPVNNVFLCKTGDKGKLFIPFVPLFTLSLPCGKIVCSLCVLCTTILVRGPSVTSLSSQLNEVAMWADNNRLLLNTSKT